MPTIQAVTWNVARQRASVLDSLVRIAPPDLATLQEVTIERQDEFRNALLQQVSSTFTTAGVSTFQANTTVTSSPAAGRSTPLNCTTPAKSCRGLNCSPRLRF